MNMDTIEMEISIPSDNDGYILLQCEHCGEYFKLTVEDCNNNDILRIVCPACGLESETYLTNDVIDLALKKSSNYAIDKIYETFKELERKTRNGTVQFKTSKRPKHEFEDPLHSGIQALEIADFPCCHHSAKIKPLLKMTGCYCPGCGVKNYEFK